MYKNTNSIFVLSLNLGKIAEIFRTVLTARSANKQQNYKIQLSFYGSYLGCITLNANPSLIRE